MAQRRTSLMLIGALFSVALMVSGVAGAQQDTPVTPTPAATPQELLERLAGLEERLPGSVPPRGIELGSEHTWGELQADATDIRTALDALEPELRDLFVDADDTDGDVARGITHVARGWLDVWTAVTSLATAEEHDVAFPVDTTDAAGVAAGADELRGELEVGAQLLITAHDRLLDGYTTLRELDEAESRLQQQINARADAAEDYGAATVPRLTWLLSLPAATVMVPTQRFETDAPGVASRAISVSVLCVDREELEELGGVATDEVLGATGVVDRADCPEPLPELVP